MSEPGGRETLPPTPGFSPRVPDAEDVRSGGSPHLGTERESAEPPSELRPGQPPSRPVGEPVGLMAASALFVALAAALVAAPSFVDIGALGQAHPAPRTLPAPAIDRVLFVRYPDFPEPIADAIRNDITARYGIRGSILISATPLDPAAWNPFRQQYGAERAIDTMLATAGGFPGERTLVIGLTGADLYIESSDWKWAFALRRGGAALVSIARMHRPLELDGARALARKMVVRQMGFLAWGLPTTDDPGDLMYRDVLDLHDLVTMADDL